MPWVKLDDQFFDHPKMCAAGKNGRALFTAALCHSSAQLTDGLITDYDLRLIAAKAEVPARSTAATLVDVNAWHRSGHECDRCPPCPDGAHIVHDYHAYQPSAKESLNRRRGLSEKRAEAGRKGAAARWNKAEPRDKEPTDDDNPMATGWQEPWQSDSNSDSNSMASGMATGWQPDGPDPEPDPPRENPPAAAHVTTPAERQQRIEEACRTYAEQAAEKEANTVGGAWINAVARGVAKDHHQALHHHLLEHPDTDTTDLTDLLWKLNPRGHPTDTDTTGGDPDFLFGTGRVPVYTAEGPLTDQERADSDTALAEFKRKRALKTHHETTT